MKISIPGFITLVSTLIFSCQSKTDRILPACCAKDHGAASSSHIGSFEGNGSIYQLQGVWLDQHNRQLPLDALKGKVEVVAMVFTHCGYACPRIEQNMKAIQDSLVGSQKDEVGFVLFSFDTERDSPARLDRFAQQQGFDDRWILLHGDAGQVRALSMLLNVKYQRLADGNFSHSNAIFILDKEGNIRSILDGIEPETGTALRTITPLIDQ